MASDIFGFLFCASIVIVSGTFLSKYGDRIAELTGMRKAWIGLVLMASVTSLPELMTGVSSVAIVGDPNLAAGDVFGSCAFNLLILSFMDLMVRKPLTSVVKPDHMLAGLFSIALMAVAGVAILTADEVEALGWVNPFSFVIIAIYLLSGFVMFNYSQKMNQVEKQKDIVISKSKRKDLQNAFLYYFGNAIVVVGASLYLPYFGHRIAEATGIGSTFFGTLFLAASTSLPELAVSISAVRIGAFDLSVGNLLGSNLFNILILAMDDFADKRDFFFDVNHSNLVSIFATILMTSVIGIDLLIRFEKKLWRFSTDAIVILSVYFSLVTYLYIIS